MKNCAVTGANGYLGGAICNALETAGWKVAPLVRRPETYGADSHHFGLGEPVEPDAFAGIDALIHCAWDFSQASVSDYFQVNVEGTRKLFATAKEAGVEKIIFVSSMSAHPGCRSNYGQAKLKCEALALEFGGAVVRPGLVWGGTDSGLHGAIETATKKLIVVPVLAGDLHSLYMCHIEDLSGFLSDLVGRDEFSSEPLIAADRTPWSMRELAAHLAEAVGKKRLFLPVPWPLVWFGLRCLETLRLKPPFRSDSVLGLTRGGALPDAKTYCDGFRPYDASQSLPS